MTWAPSQSQRHGICASARETDREALEVAVADLVEGVKAEEVDVEHRHRRAAPQPRADQRDRKVGRVHEVLACARADLSASPRA
eukprot:2856631-Rhodomonas_salina.3